MFNCRRVGVRSSGRATSKRRWWAAPLSIVLGIGLVTALPGGAGAGPSSTGASFDPSFGQGQGWTTTWAGTTSLFGNAVAVQPDGKVLVAGQSVDASGNTAVVVARFRPGGRLDRSFGVGGIFATDFPQSDGPFNGMSIAVQPRTGKAIVAGSYGLGSFLVLRLRRGGRLDHSFGEGNRGFTATPVGGFANSVAITPDGKIYLGGSDGNTPGRPMVVARYWADGRPDRRFGVGGISRLLFWDPVAASGTGVMGLRVTKGGDVVGAGHLDYIGTDGHGSAGLFRLSPTGKPRRAFGVGGHTEVAFPAPGGGMASWFPCAAAISPRGDATVVGDGSVIPSGAVMAYRLDRWGRPDRTFGAARDGRAVIPGASDGDAVNCGAAPARGGRTTVGVENVLVQFTAAGQPDAAFAAGGTLTLGAPDGVNVSGLARYGRARFVAAGFAGLATNGLYVGRVRQRVGER